MTHLRTPEFDRIAKAFGWSGDPSRIGDDAAVLPGRQVLCCDALAEGVHFRFDWSSPADVGWKAVAQNVADVLAMGAFPAKAVWSVGLGRDWDESVFAGLAKGAKAACKAYGCEIVGGDTVRTLDTGFVSLSLLGNLQTPKPWKRSGAKPGDLILLAGEPGFSAAGLAALSKGMASEPHLRRAVALHRRPKPPVEAVRNLFKAPVRAAIDLSDGLSSEIVHLSRASGVCMVLDQRNLPVSTALRKAARSLGIDDALEWVLHGGEDHCFLATAPKSIRNALPDGIRIVGRVEAGAGAWLELDKTRRKVAPLGWVHR